VRQRFGTALLVLLVLGVGAKVVAQEQETGARKSTPPLVVRCVNIAGSHIAAPKWQAESDGASGQDVLLEFGGDKELSKISWRKNGVQYSETFGLGFSMRTGFLIVIPAEDSVETYVFNAGSSELLFSGTRSGSLILPNSIKAFRGTCSLGARER
jgi:hypothetical protein